MGLKQAILQIHSLLETAGIDHALIGGFALAAHGINRSTGDIDLLVDEECKEILISCLNKAGYSIEIETPEVLHFKGPVQLDVLLARRHISKKMLARAKNTSFLNVKCLGPEDLIGLKIQAYCNDPRRELQDKADIQYLFNKYPELDLKQIKEYADLFQQWGEIRKILGIKP